jgi:hypothetical protein
LCLQPDCWTPVFSSNADPVHIPPDPDPSKEVRPNLYPRPNPNEQNKAANLLIIHWIIFNTEVDE